MLVLLSFDMFRPFACDIPSATNITRMLLVMCMIISLEIYLVDTVACDPNSVPYTLRPVSEMELALGCLSS